MAVDLIKKIPFRNVRISQYGTRVRNGVGGYEVFTSNSEFAGLPPRKIRRADERAKAKMRKRAKVNQIQKV